MIKLYNIKDLPFEETAVITIGFFDGIHKAHQKILKKTIDLAKKQKGVSILLTFSKKDSNLIEKKNFSGFLMSDFLREKILKDLGIDYLLELSMKDIWAMDPINFIKALKSKSKNLTFCVGEDFLYGKEKKWNVDSLIKMGEKGRFQVEKISEIEGIHSAIIRKALINGEIKKANTLLGRPYILYTKKVSGRKIGRTIGFPTLNQELENYVVPKVGIYYTKVMFDHKIYDAMSYIGNRPVVNGKNILLESHLLGFDGVLLDNKSYLTLFMSYVRDEIPFISLADLQKELYNDKIKIVNLIQNLPDELNNMLLEEK